jgi:hypothetical protein
VLLNFLLGPPHFEEFAALKELDVHDDLFLVCNFVIEGAKKLVISSTIFWLHMTLN